MVHYTLLDIADPAVGKFEAYEIGKQRAEGTNEEEECKGVVDLPL